MSDKITTLPVNGNARQNGHSTENGSSRRHAKVVHAAKPANGNGNGSADPNGRAREKITRVFRYLEALNQHRNPAPRHLHSQLWSLWLHDLPCHISIQRGARKSETTGKNAHEDVSPHSGKSSAENFVIKVQRPKLSLAPEPPNQVAAWLKEGWDDPFREIALRETRNQVGGRGESRAERFADDPGRLAAFRQWQSRRDEWAHNEKPARDSMKIFEALYELRGRLEREAERVELILGDGILSWRRPEGDIYHPVLLQRLQLQFNATVPEFTLSEADHPVELYSALFQTMNDVDGRAIGRCREELEKDGHHPLNDGATSRFLKRLVVQLSPRGELVEYEAPDVEHREPRIARAPVVFLRSRTLGFAAAIEGVLDDLRTCRELPWSLLNIVGEEAPIVAEEAANHDAGSAPQPVRQAEAGVFLSKPANPEQIRIAQQLEKHGGVLVQGPPGTGKTHTIANLIGHLLAQGKSVLVTSHTTKALRMVRHHIVPGLRPLCVSVLESDLDSRQQLESAVAAIAERLGSIEPGALEEEARKLTADRLVLLENLDRVLQQLKEARAGEYREIVLDGRSWTPADAARKVVQDESSHGWIPGPIQTEAALPLSPGELSELYRTNVSLSLENEHELSNGLPALSQFPAPDDFEATIDERERLVLEDLDLRSELWQRGTEQGKAARETEKQIESLAVRLLQAVEPFSGRLSDENQWKLAAVYAGRYGGAHRQPWEQLVSMVRQVHREAADAQEMLLKHDPVASESIGLKEQEQIAAEIEAHLELGGKLGSFVLWKHKPWGEFIASVRVDGGRPRLVEHFQTLRLLCRLKALRLELARRWDRQVAPLGASPASKMGDAIENTLIQFCAPIVDCLAWHESIWVPLQKELEQLGFLWNKFLAEQAVCVGAYGELARISQTVASLQPILQARLGKLRLQQIEAQLLALEGEIDLAQQAFYSSQAIAQLRDAVHRLDSAGYAAAHAHLIDLVNRRPDFDLRDALLNRLESAAPRWAACIRGREGVHGNAEIPGDLGRAWTWRRLSDELERRSGVSLEALQSQSEKLRDEIRRTTIDLIDRRAWAYQARRTSPPQRQALIGWLDTIRRIGKGTGIRVPLLRAEAARKMSECRNAVPVWVMPLSRVVENFDPRTARFDVVIIDEASQSDVMALLALYLGKSVLVVGDHEQVSPTAVGQDLGVVGNLISQYLHDIPNAHLYDGQISIYDLARQSFGGATCLVEHFRCVPEIIQFSNVVSYDQRVKPLRDASHVQLRPHMVSYRVEGSSRNEKINHQEALAVTSLIAAAMEQPEYQVNEAGRPVSFGVVSLIGDEQAVEIDRLLRTYLSPALYERHRLLCGSAAQFQGDERDVMFVSLIDTPGRTPLPLRDQQIFKQRFNVAASRGRDQMWIVHSLDPQRDLKTGDLRRQLIEHAYDPTHLMRTLEAEKEKTTQSPFARAVMKHLEARGYQVTPAWQIGAYQIDLVVEGGGKRLAIECDGDPYAPMDLNKLSDDMEKQAVLERLGWVFTRVRATVFLRDAEQGLGPVFEKLEALEIPPAAHAAEIAEAQSSAPEDLVSRVIHRADELRQEWIAPVQDPVFSGESCEAFPLDSKS
jgi:very-short-patch-repair endonuclease